MSNPLARLVALSVSFPFCASIRTFASWLSSQWRALDEFEFVKQVGSKNRKLHRIAPFVR